MQYTEQEWAQVKKLQVVENVKEAAEYCKKRRLFRYERAIKELLADMKTMAEAVQNSLELNKEYNSSDYVIITEQDGDTQNFVIKKRK